LDLRILSLSFSLDFLSPLPNPFNLILSEFPDAGQQHLLCFDIPDFYRLNIAGHLGPHGRESAVPSPFRATGLGIPGFGDLGQGNIPFQPQGQGLLLFLTRISINSLSF